MMKHEFETLAGYEVSNDDYNNIIEPMYMATNLSKAEFVKVIDKKRFALPTRKQMVAKMKKIAEHLAETCEHYSDYEAQDELEKLAHTYAERFFNLLWATDSKAYIFFNREYTIPEIKRGCTYPNELVIGRGAYEYERIILVK